MMMRFLLSGTPTAELFAASYNSISTTKDISLEIGTYGYIADESSYTNTEEYYGIYSGSIWFASPANYNTYMAGIDSSNKLSTTVHSYDSFYARYIRPVVCIQTKKFNQKYNLEDN